MTTAALSWHARVVRHMFRAPLPHLGRVGPEPRARDDGTTSDSSAERDRPADLVKSSPADVFHGVNVPSRCSCTSDDVFFALDIVQAMETDRAVRQLRVAAAVVALLPLSCLFVVAAIWTWNGASVVATGSSPLDSQANVSTTTLTLCCARRRTSTPPDNCWISSYVDAASANGVEHAQLHTDAWSDVLAYFGCTEVRFPREILYGVDDEWSNCVVNTSYCVHCNMTPKSSLSAADAVHVGQVRSSATAWIASGLTSLTAVAVVGMAFLGSAARRFHGGRLRTVIADARAALVQRRAATVEQCRCDRLLVDMLPPGIADSLKMGRRVDPETFDVASVYFSDIVGFNDVALNCESPLVIVRLLNHVFRY